jgi:uncharacterized membrane protein YedE/YeeE
MAGGGAARLAASGLAGAVFGLGLTISGMTDTTKVQGWLDIFGAWNPTLAFVMGGAIVPMAIAWQLTRRMAKPALGGTFPPATGNELGADLILGSVLFGMGWALAGLCPGPAIASVSFGGGSGLLFLLAMVAGMMAAPRFRSALIRFTRR